MADDVWVQRGAEDFAQAIESELPTGAAWSRDPEKGLMRWVDGCAQIWGDVAEAAAQLLTVESDPRFAVNMLPEWERALGLPDPCVPRVLTLPERRTALVNKLTIEGGQSRAFFQQVAATLGYEIEIREFSPFQIGVSSIGGSRGQIQPPSVRFYWVVRIAQPRTTRFQIGYSKAGNDSLLEIVRAEDLECVIRRWKPAHTVVIFDYQLYGAVFDFFFPY